MSKDDEKMFLVVEFPPTDEANDSNAEEIPKVSIIPQNWVTKENKCYWPVKMKDSMAVSKAIAQCAKPNEKFEIVSFTKILRRYSK